MHPLAEDPHRDQSRRFAAALRLAGGWPMAAFVLSGCTGTGKTFLSRL